MFNHPLHHDKMKEVNFLTRSILFYLALLYKGTECDLIIRDNKNSLSWVSAQQHCVSIGGNLMTIDNTAMNSLKLCNATPNQSFWEGRYNTFSSWILSVGCFPKNVVSQRYAKDMSRAGSVECGEICRSGSPSTTVFSIMNTTCMCLESVNETLKTTDNSCNIICPDRQERCGGSQYVNVYKAVDDGLVLNRDDDIAPFNILCGLIECTPGTGWRYYGYPCDRSLRGLCSNGQVLDGNQRWKDAELECRSSGFSLMGSDLQIECTANYSHINAPMWIQMTRDKVTRLVDGTVVTPESTCYNGEDRYRDGNFTSLDRSCNNSLISFCLIDTSSPLCTDCSYDNKTTIPPCSSPSVPTDSSTSITIIQTTRTKEPAKHSEDNSGVIAASATSGVFLTLIFIGVVSYCINKRKRKNRQDRRKSVDERLIDLSGKRTLKNNLDSGPHVNEVTNIQDETPKQNQESFQNDSNTTETSNVEDDVITQNVSEPPHIINEAVAENTTEQINIDDNAVTQNGQISKGQEEKENNKSIFVVDNPPVAKTEDNIVEEKTVLNSNNDGPKMVSVIKVEHFSSQNEEQITQL